MEEEKPTSLGRLGVRVVGMGVGLVLLYFLSVGPAIYLAAKVPATANAVAAYFRPLTWAVNHVGMPPFFTSYVGWWLKFSGVLVDGL